MTNFKNFTAAVAAVATIALGMCSWAQDDLDDLLKDLEGDAPAAAESAPAEEAPEAPAVEDEAPAEEEAPVAEAAPEADEEVPEADDEAAEPEAEEAAAEEEAPEAEEPAEEAVEEAPETEPADEAAEPEAEEEAVAEEPAEEEPAPVEAEPAVEEPAEAEPAVEEPAEEEVADVEPAEEEPAPAEAEPDDSVDSALSLLNELAAETAVVPAPAAKAPAADAADTPTPAPAPAPAPAAAPASVAAPADAELLATIRATEKLRREAYDKEAMREIKEAREAMSNREYQEAARHYGIAIKLLNDRPASKKLRKECEQGIAEGLYRAAMEEEETGRRERAVKLMEKAVEMRHPKARKQLEQWLVGGDPNANKTNYSDVKHRKNDDAFKTQREANRKHLRRARQLLAVRDIDNALDECELVLVNDPYNQEAIRLRRAIIAKRALILGQEFTAAREGMIAEVDKAWRPVYAPNARKLEEMSATTVKNALGEDPERAQEQTIIQRMKEMRLPTITFKPPATIIDAVESFKQMSRDFDRPELPLEQRGFNFVLKTGEQISMQSGGEEEEESDDFSATDNSDDSQQGGIAGVPMIPMISANDITLYEALKLVCDQVDYKFKVQGPIVMVMPKGVSTDEMMIRSYPVLSTFMERMDTASSEMKEMKSAGFGGGNSRRADDGEENHERDWKEFFGMLGVEWPEGSSIMYIKTIGKLRVKNTYENLAELEKALTEMNADPRLVEIEARFVEVEQEDLNSLGFEWILNSDYGLNTGKIGKWMGIKNGTFDATTASASSAAASSGGTASMLSGGGGTTAGTASSATSASSTNGGTWYRNPNNVNGSSVGINAFGGTSDYGNGNRYLSTEGNHVSGSGNSTNDQFMRVNAFLGSADLSMILHMLSQRNDTDLLSAPKILTKPSEEAVIKVVTEFIYPTDYDVQLQSSSSSGSSSSSSQSAVLAVVEPQSFTMREVGVILQCTPSLTDDGNLIDLKLNAQVVDEPTWKNYGMRIPFTGNANNWPDTWPELPEAIGTATLGEEVVNKIVDAWQQSFLKLISSLDSSANITYYEAPMEQPFFHVRSIDSSVSVFPGATIVMGGLITETRRAIDDKVPFLGDLPFIGRLFRSHAEKTAKRNLLIFVTTRLVDVHGREISLNGSPSAESTEVKAAPDVSAY